MVSQFSTNLNGDIELNNVIEIDIADIAQALANNPAFIAAISKEVRNQMTKDVRWMGNLFAKWAQSQPPAPTTRKRAQ
jgi:hypothetical protein